MDAEVIAPLEPKCTECKVSQVIQDTKAGDWICMSCGLVVGDRIILESQEWRSFASDDKAKGSVQDPNRTGGPSSDLMGDMQLSTVIAGDDDKSSALAQLQSRSMTGADRALLGAFERVNQLAGRLHLPQVIREHAKEIYKKVDESKALKGRGVEVVVVACVFIACRQNNIPRTIRELCELAGVARRDVGRAFNRIKLLKIYKNTGGSKKKRVAPITSSYMERFCSNLHLPRDIIKHAVFVANQVGKYGVAAGKTPGSIAGGIIYWMCELHPTEKRTTKEIANITRMAPATIKQAYVELLSSNGPDAPLLPPELAALPPASAA